MHVFLLEHKEKQMFWKHLKMSLISLALVVGMTACGGSSDTPGTGSYALTIYGESFVEEEIPAGETDGWTITFETFEVVVADISATNDDGESIEWTEQKTFSLAESSNGQGHEVATLDAPAGRYESLDYHITPGGDDWSVHVVGEATKEGETAALRDARR